jgi:hypothetical protein
MCTRVWRPALQACDLSSAACTHQSWTGIDGAGRTRPNPCMRWGGLLDSTPEGRLRRRRGRAWRPGEGSTNCVEMRDRKRLRCPVKKRARAVATRPGAATFIGERAVACARWPTAVAPKRGQERRVKRGREQAAFALRVSNSKGLGQHEEVCLLGQASTSPGRTSQRRHPQKRRLESADDGGGERKGAAGAGAAAAAGTAWADEGVRCLAAQASPQSRATPTVLWHGRAPCCPSSGLRG